MDLAAGAQPLPGSAACAGSGAAGEVVAVTGQKKGVTQPFHGGKSCPRPCCPAVPACVIWCSLCAAKA